MADKTYDIIIIGAGVVGSLIARTLSRYRLHVLLLDKASDVGEGATKANTGIVHGGYNAEPGSLKAQLNARGNPMFDKLCVQLDVPFERCGTYVVGVTPQDRHTLRDLYRRGKENDVPDLHLIDGPEMRRREPAINEDTVGALYSGTGGIVDPFELCIAAAENAVMNGVEVALETEVLDFVQDDEVVRGVVTNRGTYRSRWTIISAGLWADELMHRAGLNSFEIKPRKGEYFVLDRVASEQVHNVLFPCPTPVSKGILVTRTVHDNVILGPNADVIEDKEDLRTTASGLAEVMEGARKLVPDLDQGQAIRTFAGLRAGGNRGDFVIEIPEEVSGLVILAGIESPGLTSSPAIAEYVTHLLRESGLPLVDRPDYDPIRQDIPRFADLGREEQQSLIEQDPRYGRVICRCETVTEGEVVAACHRPIPARTYDAVKRRTRVGTGRCQGAFDTPLVIEIMARELGVSPLEITKQGPGSRFLQRRTKEVPS